MKQITRVTSKPENCDQKRWERFCHALYIDIESGFFPTIMDKGICTAIFVDLLNFTIISTLLIAENHDSAGLHAYTQSLETIHNSILARFQ